MNSSRGIAFLGTYLPQQCGIATFTDDLSTDPTLGPGDTVIETGSVLTGWVNGYDTGDQYVTVQLRTPTRLSATVAISIAGASLIPSPTNSVCPAAEAARTISTFSSGLFPACSSLMPTRSAR